MVDDELVGSHFRDVVDAVVTVVGAGLVGMNGYEFDVFGTFANGQHCEGVVGEIEGLAELLVVESADNEAVESHFHRFEEHALQCDAEVDVDEFALFGRGAADDEGLGFGAGVGEMQLGQRGTEADKRQQAVGTAVMCYEEESERLLVASGRDLVAHAYDAFELSAADDVEAVVSAVAAVAEE